MSLLTITLPDGSQQQVAAGTTPLDVAKSIGTRLADAAVVAKVNQELWDLNRPIEGDAQVQILTNKDAAALQVYRHSTAHLLAAAVLELFPETQLGIGPPTDTGFYYDFQRATKFTPEDLERIDAKMHEIQARQLPYERVMTRKDDNLAGIKLMIVQPLTPEHEPTGRRPTGASETPHRTPRTPRRCQC